MRAMITGINGFVGSHLAEYLLNLGGWEVWGIVLAEDTLLPLLQESVKPLRADLRQPSQVAEALNQAQPDVIFHLAGQAFVPESFRDPIGTFTTNVLPQINIFQTIIELQLKTRVLVIGSGEVYGAIEPTDLPLNENTPLRPASPYAVSKVTQDMLTMQYHLSHQLDLIGMRPFNHIGPRQNDRFVVPAFAKQIAQIEAGLQPPIIQVGNLTARRDFTDVRDVVQAYTRAVELGQAGQLYNLGSGRAVAVQTILDLLLADSPAQITVQIDPERMRPVQIPEIVCDASRFRACTGWEPQIPLEKTLHDALAEWRAKVNSSQA